MRRRVARHGGARRSRDLTRFVAPSVASDYGDLLRGGSMSASPILSASRTGVPSTEDARLLIESVSDYAIFMLDTTGHVATWNLGAEQIKGYSANEIIGQHFAKFYLQADIDAGKPANELRVAAEVGRVEDEGWRIRKDGSRFWASVVITALRDSTGALRGFAKVTRDLTQRRAVEEQLRRSEQRFHHLVDAVADYAIFMLEPTGRVATWNVGARRIKGYEEHEIIGAHFSSFYTPEDRASGKPERILETVRREGRYEEEGWRVRKDGSRFWASVGITALRDANNELLGFAKVTRDLTERRGASEALRQSEERFRLLVESVEDCAIYMLDPDGNVSTWNAGAQQIKGYKADEIIGQHFSLFFTPEQRQSGAPQRELSIATTEARFQEEGWRVRKDGSHFWANVVLTAIRDANGELVGFAKVTRDLTLTRAAEQTALELTREQTRRALAEVTEQRQGLLARVASALSASLDHQAMLAGFAELLVPDVTDWCVIHLFKGDLLENFTIHHIDPVKAARAREFHRAYAVDPRRHGVLRGVYDTGRSELHEEISDELLRRLARDPEHFERLRGLGLKSAMIVPIRFRDRVAGTLQLVSAESGRRYERDDLALAEELGRRAGTAVENAILYAAEKRAREQFEFVARASEALSNTLDYEETLARLVDITLPTLADVAFFDVVEGTSVRRVAAAHGDPELDAFIKGTKWLRVRRLEGSFCSLSSGESALHQDIDNAWLQEVGPEHLELLRRLQARSLATVPLRARGELLGALTMCFGRSGRHHSVDDLKIAEELARRGATAIAQARLYEQAGVAARRAEEGSRIKDEFLATVSHELRTPLNAIFGWSSLLRERTDDPSLVKGIDIIHRNAQAQGKLIEDILDVSRIITGKLRLEVKAADLKTTTRHAIEVVRPSAKAKGITISFKAPKLPCPLFADHERLQQVAWNLLSNAVKFTPPGGRISVAVRREKPSNLVLSVTDTGTGIESEFLPFVFDRFKQADGSTTRRVGGLGLGLAIVRHIVELHGGHARAESPPGKGATFTITLPVRAAVPAVHEPELPVVARPDAPASTPVKTSLTGVCVLVVDDDADARDLIETLLRTWGATVETAASASEAFALVEKVRPHVLVSDIAMPDEDGYGLMRRLRALDPSLGGGIPSIALTAYAREEDKTKALSVGFTTHIGKPVRPDDLLSTVENLARFSPRGASERRARRGRKSS
jgi:PAS domain S-box-containing protein